MKTFIITGILSIPFLAGCSTTYYVPQISDAEEFVDAEAKLHGRPATVTLFDGTDIRRDSTSLQPDSVVGVKMDTRMRPELLLLQVREITICPFGRGAVR
jgi:hypothetical protein